MKIKDRLWSLYLISVTLVSIPLIVASSVYEEIRLKQLKRRLAKHEEAW